jgi:hypothetical protein
MKEDNFDTNATEILTNKFKGIISIYADQVKKFIKINLNEIYRFLPSV